MLIANKLVKNKVYVTTLPNYKTYSRAMEIRQWGTKGQTHRSEKKTEYAETEPQTFGQSIFYKGAKVVERR